MKNLSEILEVKNVSKRFGGIIALDHCSFTVGKGSITALIGPNGSGKSTMFHVISRLVKEDSGEIWFKGENIVSQPDFQVALSGISRTFQEVRLFRNLTIQDHLELALNNEDEKLKSTLRKRKNNLPKIQEVLELVGLQKPLSTSATELSYGQRKLLDVAMALAQPHALLMLDEPVAGVNPQLRKEIKEILRKLAQQGETILLIEHDMNFVMDLAEYIYVLDNGTVIAEGKPKQIQSNKKVLEAYLGE